MNKLSSLKSIIDSISNEKNLSKEFLLNSIKNVVLLFLKNKYKVLDIEVKINIKYFFLVYVSYKIIRRKKKISLKDSFKNIPYDYFHTNYLFTKSYAKKRFISLLNNSEFKCIKKLFLDKIKNDEKSFLLENFKDKYNKIVFGVIKQVFKDFFIIDIGNKLNGILYKKYLLPNDKFEENDKIKVFFKSISYKKKYPEIILSRSCNQMIFELLKLEIPEINEGVIQIKAFARNIGVVSKVVVSSNIKNIDLIGTCVGPGGIRIANITKALGGERVEIISWNDNLIKYIINIFQNVEIKSIEMEEEKTLINLLIKRPSLENIFNINYQNVKMAEKLIGWKISIKLYD